MKPVVTEIPLEASIDAWAAAVERPAPDGPAVPDYEPQACRLPADVLLRGRTDTLTRDQYMAAVG